MGENPSLEAQEKPSPHNGEGFKEGFFESLLEKLSKEKEEKRATKKKVQQVIWLEPKTFTKILELSTKYGFAPNQICSAIIEDYLEREQKPVERIVRKVVCPECGLEVNDRKDLLMHLKENPEEARTFVHRLLLFMRGEGK